MTGREKCSLLALALMLTVALYWPGLRGGYEFDDFPNVVDNNALHVKTLEPSAWIESLWASPSSDFKRPLASLSFAVNHYFSALDPWPMKATNLAVHLLNGWLLFVLVRRVARSGNERQSRRADWIAVAVTSIWLVHPINLTAVLYVVQRMESMANLFVLIGLISYANARDRRRRGQSGAWWRLWVVVPACTLLGTAAKESAALLPLLAFVLEITVYRDVPRRADRLHLFFASFLWIPALLAVAWLLPRALAPDAYTFRGFTLEQRMLTEPRVLLSYISWIVLPLPGSFSFFRDYYTVSLSPWHPWTTLPAILAVVTSIFCAIVARKRRPLFALGVLWYFAAHAMTATFLPLELIFEHRNYFASTGILLAIADLFIPTEPAPQSRMARTIGIAVLGALLLLAAVSLLLRAFEWSNPIRLALAEAGRNPQSPRATYHLGRTYVVLSEYDKNSPYITKALEVLENSARLPRSSVLADVGLVMVASRIGQPIPDAWWNRMRDKLQSRRTMVEDSSALRSLTSCQREGRCELDDQRMMDIYLAALTVGPPDAGVLQSYAIFAQNRLDDPALAMRLTRDAVAHSSDLQYHVNLIRLLMDMKDTDGARSELQLLQRRAKLGEHASDIDEITRTLDRK